jgi:hypothetical protein
MEKSEYKYWVAKPNSKTQNSRFMPGIPGHAIGTLPTNLLINGLGTRRVKTAESSKALPSSTLNFPGTRPTTHQQYSNGYFLCSKRTPL